MSPSRGAHWGYSRGRLRFIGNKQGAVLSREAALMTNRAVLMDGEVVGEAFNAILTCGRKTRKGCRSVCKIRSYSQVVHKRGMLSPWARCCLYRSPVNIPHASPSRPAKRKKEKKSRHCLGPAGRPMHCSDARRVRDVKSIDATGDLQIQV